MNSLKTRTGKAGVALIVAGGAVGGVIAAKSGGSKSPDRAVAAASANTGKHDEPNKPKTTTTTTSAITKTTSSGNTANSAPQVNLDNFSASANMCDNPYITAAAEQVLGTTAVTCAHGYTPYAEGIDAYGTHWDPASGSNDGTNEVGFQLLSFSPGHKLDASKIKGQETTVDGFPCVMDDQHQMVCALGDKGLAETNLPVTGGQNNSVEDNKAFMEALIHAATEQQ